jgi:hypothetical protein
VRGAVGNDPGGELEPTEDSGKLECQRRNAGANELIDRLPYMILWECRQSSPCTCIFPASSSETRHLMSKQCKNCQKKVPRTPQRDARGRCTTTQWSPAEFLRWGDGHGASC